MALDEFEQNDLVFSALCLEQDVFTCYVSSYFVEAKGYFPLNRDFGQTTHLQPIDVVNKLFPIKIKAFIVNNDSGSIDLTPANHMSDDTPVTDYVLHRGVHFERLVLQQIDGDHI